MKKIVLLLSVMMSTQFSSVSYAQYYQYNNSRSTSDNLASIAVVGCAVIGGALAYKYYSDHYTVEGISARASSQIEYIESCFNNNNILNTNYVMSTSNIAEVVNAIKPDNSFGSSNYTYYHAAAMVTVLHSKSAAICSNIENDYRSLPGANPNKEVNYPDLMKKINTITYNNVILLKISTFIQSTKKYKQEQQQVNFEIQQKTDRERLAIERIQLGINQQQADTQATQAQTEVVNTINRLGPLKYVQGLIISKIPWGKLAVTAVIALLCLGNR